MSRIGKLPINIADGIDVKIDGNKIVVKGSKGQLEHILPAGVKALVQDKQLIVSIDSIEHNNLWGLSRTLISNMIEGVSKGFEKKLMIFGVGFNAAVQGQSLRFNLGFSHPVIFPLPSIVSAKVEKNQKGNDIITLTSIDKQKLGEVAAKIRSLRAPEPYKGKGIRYFDEVIKLKAGKTEKKK